MVALRHAGGRVLLCLSGVLFGGPLAAAGIGDVTPPVLYCPADFVAVWNGDEPAVPDPVVEDDLDPAPEVVHERECFWSGTDPVSCGDWSTFAGVVWHTWTATDSSGNSASCLTEVEIVDLTPPVVACPEDIAVLYPHATDPDLTGEPLVTDNIAVDGWGPEDEWFEDRVERTWTAVDIYGNTASCTQVITWTCTDGSCADGEDLSTCPEDCCPDPVCVDQPVVVVDDNCQSYLVPSEVLEDPELVCDGVYVVEVADVDPSNGPVIDGPQGEMSFTVVQPFTEASCEGIVAGAEDRAAPVLFCEDTEVACDDEPWPPFAVDNCVEYPAWEWSDEVSPGACDQASTVDRLWTATDPSGNSASCSSVIEVVDVEGPVIEFFGVEGPFECATDLVLSTEDDFLVTDSCSPTVESFLQTITVEGADPSCPESFVVQRLYAVDPCENLTVHEVGHFPLNEGPVAECEPDRFVLTAEDIDSPAPEVTTSCELGYSTDVEWMESEDGQVTTAWHTAQDACGRTAECAQSFTLACVEGGSCQEDADCRLGELGTGTCEADTLCAPACVPWWSPCENSDDCAGGMCDGGICLSCGEAACPADSSRTEGGLAVFEDVCGAYSLDRAGCERTFATGPDGEVWSCWYNEDDEWAPLGACLSCDEWAEYNGQCTNTCYVEPVCEDDSSLVYAGSGMIDWMCSEHDGDPLGCAGAYGGDPRGEALSCFYDATGELWGEPGRCVGCEPGLAGEGFCDNTCYVPPECEGAPERVFAAQGDWDWACAEHDGDPVGCAVAYAVDHQGQLMSCWYDAEGELWGQPGRCFGCGMELEDRGSCANDCGADCEGVEDLAECAALTTCGVFDQRSCACSPCEAVVGEPCVDKACCVEHGRFVGEKGKDTHGAYVSCVAHAAKECGLGKRATAVVEAARDSDVNRP